MEDSSHQCEKTHLETFYKMIIRKSLDIMTWYLKIMTYLSQNNEGHKTDLFTYLGVRSQGAFKFSLVSRAQQTSPSGWLHTGAPKPKRNAVEMMLKDLLQSHGWERIVCFLQPRVRLRQTQEAAQTTAEPAGSPRSYSARVVKTTFSLHANSLPVNYKAIKFCTEDVLLVLQILPPCPVHNIWTLCVVWWMILV